VFQPIVELANGKVMGYEALGRGTHASLSPNPTELFSLAEQCNLSTELSRVFRHVAIQEAARLPEGARLFFNLHPSEMARDSLLDALQELQLAYPGRQVVLEVHEGVVTDLATMRWLREQVDARGLALAYDDFGAGQSRLSELAEVPPDFIKLDRSLVRGIDRADARKELVQALNRVITDLGVHSLAEGVETPEEARVCQELGSRFGQGFLFGRPKTVEELFPTSVLSAAATQA
jgi:EAL domain-containing protein (putative c-di-GMP-specific phosphodiesterase class I)